MLKNLKISTKLIGGFLIAALILLIVGVLGFISTRTMGEKAAAITEAASLRDSAMQMNQSIKTDLWLAMRLREASDLESLDELWDEHEQNAQVFSDLADTILNGGETAEGTIAATHDESIRALVEQVHQSHMDEFEPAIQSIYDLKVQIQEEQDGIDEKIEDYEAAVDRFNELAKDFEQEVKARAVSRAAAGTSAKEILNTETIWSAIAIEIKAMLAKAPLLMEEFALSRDASSSDAIEEEFAATISDLESLIEALLNGGETELGTVKSIDDPKLRSIVVEMDRIQDEEFQVAASGFIEQQKNLVSLESDLPAYAQEIDQIGNDILGLLETVDQQSLDAITTAEAESEAAASQGTTQTIAGIAIGFVFAIGIGLFLSRSVSKPVATVADAIKTIAEVDLPNFATEIGLLAEGDLTRTFEIASEEIPINSGDEIGLMAKAFNGVIARLQDAGLAFDRMAENLKEMVTSVMDAANNVDAAATQLSSAADQSSQATEQIATTIQQVAQGTQQQTESVTKTAATIEQMGRAIDGVAQGTQEQSEAVAKSSEITSQMNAAIQQISANAQKSSAGASEAAVAAREGTRIVDETVEGMRLIKEKVAISSEKVEQMGERSEQIGQIIETIDDIASQTNLLALNAAIEAARAGEHGKGFAVVAEEVRKLAERTVAATQEIGQLIADMQASVTEAVSAMGESEEQVEVGTSKANEAGEALQSILKAVEDVNRQIEEISAASEEIAASSDELVSAVDTLSSIAEENNAAAEEMAAGSSEINQAFENIASVSEENSAAVEEVSAAAEEMNAQVEEVGASAGALAEMATDLQELVAKFTLEHSGKGEARVVSRQQDGTTLGSAKDETAREKLPLAGDPGPEPVQQGVQGSDGKAQA